MLVAWLTLHWGILPRLDHWRPQIESRVGAAIGAPLRIGAIRVRSGSWVPAFELDDVRLLDREGRVALQLGRVSAALSPASLLALELRFAQLHLDGVQIDLRRDAAGRVFVAGLGLDTAMPADSAADWFFEQHEFVIRHGALRWTDELAGAPPLQLSDVDLVLRNSRRRHELRLDATPPPDWGARFALRGKFMQPLLARASDWQRWSGSLYVELPLADVSQLRQHLRLPFELDSGRGALRSWLEIEDGRPVQGTADVALAGVALRLAPTLPPLVLQQLQGRLAARRHAEGLDLRVEQLRFVSDDAVPWGPTSARLALQQAAPGADGAAAPVRGGTLAVDRLELAPLARLAARLPLPPALHRALDELAPQGRLQGLDLAWRGPPQAPLGYRVQARARALALGAGPAGPPADGGAPSAGRPGLRGADIDFDATEAAGHAQLTLKDGALVFPGVFEQPVLPITALSAVLSWRVQPGAPATPGTPATPAAFELTVRDATLSNADLRASLAGRWRTGPGSGFGEGRRWPGQIELSGRLLGGNAARVARYLPLGVSETARRYVERAIASGRVTEGDFEVRGDLWQFPFADGRTGRFHVRAKAQDLQLAYVPSEPGWTSPWPAMSAVAGELEFDGGAMRIRDARAMVGGFALRGVHGGIADLVHQPVLQLDGQGRGAAAELLRFVDTSPVGGWIGGALHETRASGAAELTLGLTIPLDDPGQSQVRGAVQLAGNDLQLQPGTPSLGAARGRVDFSERGFGIVGGRARVLGGDVSFEGGTQPDGTLRITGQGLATAEGLLRAGDVPALAPLQGLGPRRLSGQAPYRVQLDIVHGAPSLQLSSSLAGLAIDLPPPLNKPAAAAWPLRVQTTRLGDGTADLLRVDLGELLQARYERDLSGPEPRVRRGAVGLGAAAPPLPAAGVTAVLQLPRLDLDAWRELASRSGTTPGLDAGVMPTRATLRTAELTLAGRRLTDVTLELQRQATLADTRWRAEVRAEQAEGVVELRQPREAGVPGRVTARLARLTVPAADSGGVETLLEQAPASVPALDLVIDDFHWRGKALGRLEVEAVNRAAPGRPGVREWQLDRLLLGAPDAQLQGSGRWSAGRRMALDFALELSDSGKFAQRMGAGSGLQGGKGRIEGQLSWAGSPLSPDAASLDGALKIELAEGRFLHAEPGAARLLGVLSLQALPRRLLLDFRDVFQQGFAFDRVSGDVTLAGGVARTDNLRLVGVQAAVLIEGSADLARETQDLRIVAVPEINAGAASLAYAAINPAIGLGTFLAQWLLREPMMAAGTREFHVTGSWADPQVERVGRAGAAAAASAPASAPAAPAKEGRSP